MAGSLLDEVAGPAPQPQAQNPPVNASNQGSLLDQVAAEQTPTTPVSTTNTGATSPSYLDEVQNHVTNTAKALWHGVVGTPETPEETGAPAGTPPKQLGFTNENVAYNLGNLGRGVAGFLGGVAKDLTSKMPAVVPDEKNISWSDPKANTLLGKYIAAPSEQERQKALAEAEAYTKSKGTAAIGHLLNTYVHTAGEYLPVAGPFVTSLIDKAEGGDVGGATAQVAALAAAHPVSEAAADTVNRTLGRTPLTDTEWDRVKLDALNSTVKGPKPRVPNTVVGPRTTFTPTTQTTAGVEAPISAVQQENPSAATKFAAENLTNTGSAKEFQKTQTAPAATRQLASVVGQVAEDKINRHNAIMEGKPTPDKIAGTQTPSKYQTHDEAAQAAEATAQKTYRKADAASDADIAAWQQTVKEALNEHKALLDRHNANIDAYNENLAEGEEKMPHAVYDPNSVRIPEKPQSYSELKAELDRAKAESNSSDAAVREEAYKTGIPKAEKAIDQWFKQHSDVISPAEYDSAKGLYSDSQRFQEIANGLRAATNKGAITGNTLRGLEASIDNKMIRRGQAPGAFQRLLGDEGYDNWQTVTKLFDPIKNAPKGIKSWGVYALEAASALVAPKLAIAGIAGTMATKFLMDRIMFNPAWGAWFSKFATGLKDMVTREHGELGAPGTVGEKFGEGGAKREFNELMDRAQGKAAAEVKAQAQPASLLDQVAKPEPSVAPPSGGRWPAGADDSVIESHYATMYPEVPEGTKVDGRTVIDSVDNMSSIAASIPNYLILDGIRKVDFRQFDMKPSITPRTKALAEQIKNSGELMPLIVGVDANGPYIMEGSHRYDALKILGAKEIPAIVALDLDELRQEKDTSPTTVQRPNGFNVEAPGGKLQIEKSGKDSAYVSAVDVDEDKQRQGIATQLYEQARKELLRQGITKLRGSLEGSGPVQLREKVFGKGNTKYFHGGEEISPEQAIKIMDKDFGYVKAETNLEQRAVPRPTMSATELEDAIKNRRPINNPFDQTEGARATMNRDPNMPQPAGVPQGLPEARPTMHQMTSLGTGDYKVSADFNPPVAHPELKGTPEPALGRKPNGQPDWSKLQDIADWKNANVAHEDALNSALHEVAHTEVQHALGVPTENVRIKLGHSAMRKGVPPLEGGRPSSSNGLSGGFLDPGGAWQEKMDAAYQTGDPSQIKSVIKDWVTQLMAGRAVEEMTGMPYSKIQEHIKADVAMAKQALKNADVPSYIHDALLTESTNAAKAILHQNFDKVRHTATQAINHYGAEPIDGKTFLKYRNGGVYEGKVESKSVKPYSEWTREEKNRDWAIRSKLPIDDKGRVTLYHATPESNSASVAKEGLRPGSFLTDDIDTAIHQASRSGERKEPHHVYEAKVPLGSFYGGTWAQTIDHLHPSNLKRIK